MSKNYWWLMPVIVGTLLYLNSIKGTFFWDDYGVILENPKIKTWKGSLSTFLPNYWKKEFFGTKGAYRPLRHLTFSLDYAIWGTNPSGYRLTNVLLNTITICCVSLLAKEIFSSNFVALFSGMLFSIHPAHMESINYIKNRGEMLCAIFFILTIYLWVKKKFLLSMLVYILCLLSKEYAIMLPFVLFTMKLFILKDRKMLHLLPYFVLSSAFILWCFAVIKHGAEPNIPDPLISNVNIIQRVISTVTQYIFLLFLPVKLQVDRVLKIYSLGLSVVIMFVYLFILLFLYILWRKNLLSGQLFFSIFLIFLLLIPVANIFILGGRAFAEQRLYLPSIGWALFISGVVYEVCKNSSVAKKISLGCLIIVTIIFGITIIKRNILWSNELLLWQQALKDNPGSSRAVENLANCYLRVGEYDAAEKLYLKLITDWKLNSDEVYNNLGIIYQAKNNLEQARYYFMKSIEINQNQQEAYVNLSTVHILKGEYDIAIDILKKLINSYPDYAQPYVNLGVIYLNYKDYNSAASCFRKALELNPDLIEARLNLAKVLNKLGFYADAQEELKEVELRMKSAGKIYKPTVEIK